MDVALFSPASLFHSELDDENAGGAVQEDEEKSDQNHQQEEVYLERTHAFPKMDLIIREFAFHQLNANLLWPGTFSFAEWLVQNMCILSGARVLELGSGTGALAIFLKKSVGVDITTSDYDDTEIEENIAYNCTANGLDVMPHIRHSWGDVFPTSDPDWDLIIASDILLYVKQYPNLIKTLCFLLNAYKPILKPDAPSSSQKTLTILGKEVHLHWPAFIMSWRRRIVKEDEALFFRGCENAGLVVRHLGSRVYCINPSQGICQ